MKKTIFGIILFVSIVFILGTLGAYDHDVIGIVQMWIQLIIGAIALVVSAQIVYLEDERYGEDDRKDM